MSALIQFINSHDGCRVVASSGGLLTVTSLCVDTHGKVFEVSETINATMRSARDWLGY